MTEGWSKKVFLKLNPPAPEDAVPLQERILRGLGEKEAVRIRPAVLGEAREILKKSG